ncbi:MULTISPECIES: replicative DNA helicase [unclassified Veillonella]|jgi:replicative DNA helicase|uniref:replicative DNA helicase n=1 Tax=unclassified Veillonella TaxID=2630086 RepID=UPI000F8F628C|nr:MULTISPECIES: replicative DNA helicase [unclassified Veillonella]
MSGRIPPHSIEAERAVLGAILLNKDAFDAVSSIVKAEDFYSDNHRVIYEALVSIVGKNQRADYVLLSEELKKSQKLEAVGGILYLTNLTTDIVDAYNVEDHAKIVRDKAHLRKLIHVANAVESMAYREEEETEDIVNRAEQMVLDVSGTTKGESSFSAMRDVVYETIDRINELQRHKGILTGVSTGFKDLDNLTSGLQKSDLILVAARPSMGKTAFTLNIAQNVAMKSKKNVAFFSLEMSKTQLVARVLAAVAGINSGRIRNGQLSQEDWGKAINALNDLAEAPLYIDDTSGLTPQLMKKKLRRLIQEHGELGLVVVDYIQLMENGGKKMADNRQQEVSAISRQLKIMAREFNVPLIALSQLSRGVESRADKTPMLSDLRESGSLEQDADIVAFLNRENYQDTEDTSDGVETQVIIRKHRNGELGIVKLWFEGAYTRFRDLAYREDDPGM